MIGALATAVILGNGMMKMDSAELIRASWSKTHVVGHRGAAAYEPENTIASFKKAVSVGAHATECDVHMSSDGVPMVIHDKTLDRTFPGLKGVVAETLGAKMVGAGVPTLADYISELKGKIVQVIEIKDGAGVVEATIKEIRRRGTEKETIIFSFNSGFVKEAKQLAPEVTAVWLVAAKYEEAKLDDLVKAKAESGADALGFQYRNVYEGLAKRLRDEKCPLFVWTVPPGAEVDRLKQLRVNFIITDHPQDVLSQLGF